MRRSLIWFSLKKKKKKKKKKADLYQVYFSCEIIMNFIATSKVTKINRHFDLKKKS